ncbi:MAG: transglycosylase SLT domain-containing protein [Desulfobulbaceae bacterium]|nr:transglycosylase SLT domain-containing protein [Desulfobulbaceae bacterium]
MDNYKLNIEKPDPSKIYESQINDLKNRVRSTAKINLSESDKLGLEKAARGFEAIFMNMMFKEIRNAQLDDESDEGFGSDILMDYSYLMLTDKISSTGKGIGIAEQVYKFFTNEEIPTKNIIEKTIPTEPLQIITTNSSKPINSKVVETNNEIGGTFFDRVKQRLNQFDDIISQASDKYNLDKTLIKSVITAESAGQVNAKSIAGAKGLMQLMDGTARDLGVTNSFDPEENIMGGARYLRQMLDKFNNDTNLALAAYNAGPGNVEKYNGIPPFKETENYVRKVNKYLNQF